MAEREPRPSTDQESAPLLDREPDEGGNGSHSRPGLAKRLTEAVQEPLTGLTKVLLVEVLILLIIASVFIGLFAGAQHKLNLRGGGGGGGERGDQTETVTVTSTTASTIVSATTTTAVSTEILTTTDILTKTKTDTTTATKTKIQTSVSTYTTTDIRTRTIIVGPEPTGPPAPPPGPPTSEVCLTPDCIILSAAILSSLDSSQDPCENFFDFANGGWISSHPIPGDKGGVSNFQLVAEQNGQLLQKLLETKPKFPSHLDSYDEQLLHKLRTLYSSCMDESKLDYIGQEPLQHFVNNIKKLYRGQSTNTDLAGSQGLSNALAYLHSRGVEALFEFSVDGDAGVDPNAMTLWFSQPSLGLPAKEYYKERDVLETYQNVIERLLNALYDDLSLTDADADIPKRPSLVVQGGQLENTDHVWPPWPWPPWDGDGDERRGEPNKPRAPPRGAHELAKKVVDFETEIAEATLDLDRLQQDPFGTYNPMPFYTLKSSLPNINFPDYFATFTPRAFPSRVIVTYKPYPSSLSEILRKTSSDVVEAYLVIRAALEYAPNLGTSTEAWKAVRTLEETLGGLKKGAVGERSQFCMKKVENALGYATGRFFVNATFPGESKQKATKVIDDIIEAFEDSLDHLPWMDEESARRATEKAEALRVKVGFPMYPSTLDPHAISNYYALVKVHTDTFFDNMLSAASSEVYKMWQKLGKRRNLDEWEMFASTVNAYYNPPGNEIVFPAGILQPPFFSQDWPGYMSYGSFGMVAAHELTHAFDSSGRLYNQQGKLEEWWTPETSQGYQVKQDCIVKQYSGYTVDDGNGGVVHVNGNLTSGENIGDTGLIQAYRAWKAQYQDSYDAGTEYLLPGLEFTREQLFFISFARTWAMNNRAADAVQRVRSDPHSPNRYRTEGTVFNIPEFAKAFQCSKHAKLNPPPEDQCIFWS
ncbi:Metalloprotease [Hygrophoropsis aurantiaca]|uniref:Metalloprotease n=1 Tax=Hygrophoropsis aurantiaca TaxID=72124 RepID=A0ACB8A8C9_9AGAM|nr:Metalloprotease [Hygrophoropsis aurantiaca]